MLVRVPTSAVEVRAAVEAFAAEEGHGLTEREDGRELILEAYPDGYLGFDAKVEIHDRDSKGSLLRVGSRASSGYVLLAALITFIYIVPLLWLVKSDGMQALLMSGNLVPLLAVAFGVLLQHWLRKAYTSRVEGFSKRLLRLLVPGGDAKQDVEVLIPLDMEGQLGGQAIQGTLFAALFLIMLGAGFPSVVIAGCFLTMAPMVMLVWLGHLQSESPFLQWRRVLNEVNSLWTWLSTNIVGLVVAGVIGVRFVRTLNETLPGGAHEGRLSMLDIMSSWQGIGLKDFTSRNGHAQPIEYLVESIEQFFANAPEVNFTVLGVVPSAATAGLSVLFIIATFTWVRIHIYIGIVGAAKEWREKTTKDDGELEIPRFRPGSRKEEHLLRLSTWTFTTLAWFLHVVGLAFTIDCLAFALSESVVLFGGLEEVFAWIPVAWILLLGQEQSDLARVLGFATFIPWVVPLVVYSAFWLVRLAMSIWRTVQRTPAQTVESSVVEFVRGVRERYGLQTPKLTVVRHPGAFIVTDVGWPWTRRPEIRITETALGGLSSSELKAALVHELGHLRHGLRGLRLSRLVSVIALFPNSHLLTTYDHVSLEYEADDFCIESGIDPSDLASALLRLVALQRAPHEDRWSGLLCRLWGDVRLAISFLFGEGKVDYQYPYLPERVNRILAHAD